MALPLETPVLQLFPGDSGVALSEYRCPVPLSKLKRFGNHHINLPICFTH